MMVIAGMLDPQFPVDGAQEVIDQLQEIYDAVGAERLHLAAINADHGYDREMRQAAYGWFRRWLQGEGDGSPVPEPPLVTEPPDSPDLKCFPGTPAIRSWPAIRALARDYHQIVVREPELPDTAAGWASWRAGLRQKLAECLGGLVLGEAAARIEGRSGGPEGFERHLLEPEPGIVTPAFVARPAGPVKATVVYLCDQGKLAGPGPDLLPAVVEEGGLVLAIDPRGLGETSPVPPPRQTVATLDGKLEYRATEPEDTLEFEAATDALMLGRSLFGQQLSDLLNGIDYAARLAPAAPLVVAGSGPIASLLALYAGALSERAGGVLADGLLPSYRLLIEEDEQVFPVTAYVFGILRVADVAQVAGTIAPRPLVISRPSGARLQALEPAEASRLLQWAISAYRQQGAPAPAVLPSLPAQALLELVRQTKV
jgi:hypothetical protein